MHCYFSRINYTRSSKLHVFPNLKILKDWVKDGLKEYKEHGTGIKCLSSVDFVRLGSKPEKFEGSEDVTKWFFESYYSSHASKEQKKWLEENIFNK